MQKKRTFTLLEIMIVIFLIGLIGGIVSYSMKGSLTEGKAFKTEQAIMRVRDLIELELARGATHEQINGNLIGMLTAQGVVKNPESMLKDGWGKPLQINVKDNQEIEIISAELETYKAKKAQERGYAITEN